MNAVDHHWGRRHAPRPGAEGPETFEPLIAAGFGHPLPQLELWLSNFPHTPGSKRPSPGGGGNPAPAPPLGARTSRTLLAKLTTGHKRLGTRRVLGRTRTIAGRARFFFPEKGGPGSIPNEGPCRSAPVLPGSLHARPLRPPAGTIQISNSEIHDRRMNRRARAIAAVFPRRTGPKPACRRLQGARSS